MKNPFRSHISDEIYLPPEIKQKKEKPLESLERKFWKISLFAPHFHRAETKKLENFAQSRKMILVFKQRRCAYLQGEGKNC